MKDQAKKQRLATIANKYHLNFFILALALFLLNAILYEFTALLPLENHHFYMAIDDAIPLIPEFTFFYWIFYVCPTLFIWWLSFYDKKKATAIIFGGFVALILSFIVFLIYNVQMIRPEAEVEAYWFFDGSITNVHEFFLALNHLTFKLDPMARNGIPSLHAMFAGLVFLCGMWFPTKEKHAPIVLRVLAIVFGIGIACSTFFTKQHYFIDAVVGFGLAVVMYLIFIPIVNKMMKKYPENRTIKLLTDDSFEG